MLHTFRPSGGGLASANTGASGNLFTHFFASTYSGVFSPLEFSGNGSGTGVSFTALTAPDATSLGAIDLNCGTQTNSRQGILTAASSIRFGGGVLDLTWRFRVPTLPDGTDSFACYLGFGDAMNVDPVDGAFIYLSQASANFRYRTRANNVQTDVDSGLAAVAGTWYKGRILVNNAAASINFTIDGGSSQDITTNIPTGSGRETGIIANIIKSAGTNARNLHIDYCSLSWSGVSA